MSPPNPNRKEKIKIKKLKPNPTNEEIIEKIDQIVEVIDRLGIVILKANDKDLTISFDPGESHKELAKEKMNKRFNIQP